MNAILIVLLIVLLFGGAWHGHGAGYTPLHYGIGSVVSLIVLLLLLRLFGVI